MDLTNNKELILAIFIVMIILINVWLFTSLKKNKSNQTFHILKKSTDVLKDPFKKEYQDINELSRMIKELDNNDKNKENL